MLSGSHDAVTNSGGYEWPVVSGGNHARFKSVGALAVEGAHKLMLWPSDDDPDTFRIKIWDEDAHGNETVIYDNGLDQAFGGGSTVQFSDFDHDLPLRCTKLGLEPE